MVTRFIHKAIADGKGHLAIRIWKMDLKGAFKLLSFRPCDVELMASELPGKLMAFFLCVTFGWGCTPFAFQTITRTITWELRKVKRTGWGNTEKGWIKGDATMYVDDFIGVSFDKDVVDDMKGVKRLCEKLLGPGSISDKKSEVDEDGKLDVIGYTIDIKRRIVSVAQRNVKKAFYATTEIDTDGKVTLEQMQRIASHASRYKKICPYMAPFAHALHHAQRGHPNGNRYPFPLPPDAQRAVWVLRALILLTATGGEEYTRSFQSMTKAATGHSWVIEYDASLTGIGLSGSR